MCGIAGFLSEPDHGCHYGWEAVLRSMGDAIRHRGPDDAGTWHDRAAGVALVHRRLSILDLSPAGHQPMLSESGRFVLIFNGEIYNHLELRKELAGRGAKTAWRGHSDTETLLACFEDWGVQPTLERTVGMFALALWDRNDRRAYFARDRFGEKPLYYGWARGCFLFGSDLAALRRHPAFSNEVDRDVAALYLRFGYVPAPYSIYRGIYKLQPGCILALSLLDAQVAPAEAPFAPTSTGSLTLQQYWSLAQVAREGSTQPILDETEAVNALEAALNRSVSEQSIADVPLGAFLSGGVDSSTIVALMQAQSSRKIRTFTIGFSEPSFNEAEYAKSVASHLGTDHTELYVSPKQTLDAVSLLPSMYTEPFADPSQLPTFLVSRVARSAVTVALSGDAGDELFGGYNRYLWGRRLWDRVGWMPLQVRRALGGAATRIPESAWDALGSSMPVRWRANRFGEKARRMGERLSSIRTPDDLYRSLVTEWKPESGIVPGARVLRTVVDDTGAVAGLRDPENRMMAWDAQSYLPDDILQKVDRASMAVSLETRAPFLDHRVAELAWRIPLAMKIRNGQGKWVLRKVLYRHVPPELIDRPKSGFGIPVGEWLRRDLRPWAEELFERRRIESTGLLDSGIVRKAWEEHVAGTRDWSSRLWSVLMLQAWLEQQERPC